MRKAQPVTVACLRQEDTEGGRSIGALKNGFAGKGVDTATGRDSKEVAAGPPTSRTWTKASRLIGAKAPE
jgi:hypothetical protein